MPILSCLSGRSKRLSAFQARVLGPRRDEPAKGAHPLRCETGSRRRDKCKQLRDGRRNGGEASTKPITKSVKSALHQRSTFIVSPQVRMVPLGGQGSAVEKVLPYSYLASPPKVDDDTLARVFLCKIAHPARKYRPRYCGHRESQFWVIDFDEPAKVSNVDQPSSW
jgi:hypothetical protein